MAPFTKVLLAVLVGALVLGGLFYLWLVIAFTPPKGPSDGTSHYLVKEGKLGNDVYFQILRNEKDKVVQHFEVRSGTREAAGKVFYSRLLRVYGAPTPIDVQLAGPQQLQVIFDGTLENGATSTVIAVSEAYTALQPHEVRAGKMGLSETW